MVYQPIGKPFQVPPLSASAKATALEEG